MTTKERIEATEADLATVSVPEGMHVPWPTPSRTRSDATATPRSARMPRPRHPPADNVVHDD